MKSIKRICLFTATGAENLGDEMITLCEIQEFLKRDGEIHITLFSHDCARTKRFLVSQNTPLNNIIIKEYFPNNIRKYPLKNFLLFWDTLKSIRNTHHVYIGGGGLFYGKKEEGHSPLRLWWFRAIIVKFFRKPLTYLSLGISTTEKEIRPFAKGLFTNATVTTRDTKSQKTLSQLGFESKILPDPVFNYSGDKKINSKIIGVAMRKGFMDDKVIMDILKKLLSKGYEILLLPHSLHPTDEVSHDGYYLQVFLLPGVMTTQSIDQTLASYKQCHIILSMRLHSMILAIDHHIPFIGISYSQKTNTLLSEIEWKYTHSSGVDSAEILSDVEDIESNYSGLEKKLTEYHKNSQELYKKNFLGI